MAATPKVPRPEWKRAQAFKNFRRCHHLVPLVRKEEFGVRRTATHRLSSGLGRRAKKWYHVGQRFKVENEPCGGTYRLREGRLVKNWIPRGYGEIEWSGEICPKHLVSTEGWDFFGEAPQGAPLNEVGPRPLGLGASFADRHNLLDGTEAYDITTSHD